VPCGLIFNECPRDDWIREAIIAGFNLVMPADPKASYGDYFRRVKELTGYAHSHDVAVEAEIGELPCGVSGEADGKGQLTDPEIASRFVEETGVDLLAVSAGNVHVMVNAEQDLDLDLLAEIHERISTPLVLHGGTGITASSLKRAIPLGVVKVNYGTYLKQRYINALSAAIGTETANPHEVLGLGGDRDLMVAGRVAVRDAVRERIGLLGCRGKAEK
jgi:fructose/tagatose bisphosphate aldolase